MPDTENGTKSNFLKTGNILGHFYGSNYLRSYMTHKDMHISPKNEIQLDFLRNIGKFCENQSVSGITVKSDNPLKNVKY